MPDRTVLLSEYLAGPGLIEQCVANCSEEELEQRETPGEWSVRQIIHHVADVEVGDAMRLRLMVSHESPLIVAYDEKLFASRLYYDRPIATSLATFTSLRASNGEIVERLPEAGWSRTGHHEEHDLYSVEILVRKSIDHDRLHLAQIKRARQSGA